MVLKKPVLQPGTPEQPGTPGLFLDVTVFLGLVHAVLKGSQRSSFHYYTNEEINFLLLDRLSAVQLQT